MKLSFDTSGILRSCVCLLAAFSILGCRAVLRTPISTPQCNIVSLLPGSSFNGRLEDNDCQAPHRLGKKADLYTFEGKAGQQITITMTSSTFDPFLAIVGSDGIIVDSNDDISASDRSARIQRSLPWAGRYTIEASTATERGRGPYTLSLAISPISTPNCSTTFLMLGDQISGHLIDADCEAPHWRGHKADLHTFEGTAGQQVIITMTSSAFDAYLILVGPDGTTVKANDDISPANRNSRLHERLPMSGRYTLEASTATASGRGAYTLALTLPQIATISCRSTALPLGSRITGQLEDSDCEAPHLRSRKADLYTFQGTAGQQVTITMASAGFDRYLILVGQDGQIVEVAAKHDPIQVRLPSSGSYTIEASAVKEVGRGDYTLVLLLKEGNITVGGPNGGENWAIGSTQTIRWNSAGISGDVKIELSLDGGKSWSTLFGRSTNDGSEGWTVTGTATSQARIRISSIAAPSIASTSEANFTISPRPCLTTSITSGITVNIVAENNGTVADGDCEAPHWRGRKADLYTFEGTAGQQVTITMTSSAFDSYLILVGPDGTIVDSNDDISSADRSSRIQRSLPTSGRYTLEASTATESGRGDYALALSLRTPSPPSEVHGRPYSVEAIMDLLRSGVRSKRMVTLIRDRGVGFELTSDVLDQLRQTGADDNVINAVRANRRL